MSSKDIRRGFLNYFKTQSHTIVPSSPVIPHDDPTILFTNAGMNQFKDVFLGKSQRDYKRASTSQKCIRAGGKHNDLENVGHTSRHLTFFEMLGNFSFGDYFKKDAIRFAWDVSTHVFGFDPEKIWVSVFKDDDEAFQLWEPFIPAKRIVRFGEKENFWAMGETGPCGPCSELLYDRGPAYSKAQNPYEDLSGERFLEFWNLVFMQFSKQENGSLVPLPKQSIDTGAGLERVVSLKMNVDSVFATDILRSLIAQVEEVSGISYDKHNTQLAPAFHVIADHIRTLSFAIADGAQPSNVERGYILRKILRRAVRYGRLLGFKKPFLATIFPKLILEMGEDFPELVSSKQRICEVLDQEEEAFLRTLHKGGNLLSQVIENTTKGRIKGEDAFKLKDTYGFPIEEISLIAKDYHLEVDLARFNALEEEAKNLSRKAKKTIVQTFDENFFSSFAKVHPPCHFEGYTTSQTSSKILAILVNQKFVDQIQEGEEGLLILDKTPFYAEMGGQVGDQGTITKGNATFEVQNCISPYTGVIAHVGVLTQGVLRKQDSVTAAIDVKRREQISAHHTATHLLHHALEKVLGSHIRQAGSVVDEHHLRFDFTHHKPLSKEELCQIEDLVNEKIRGNQAVNIYHLSLEEVQKKSDVKQIFGEKYGKEVRVIDLDYSKELCGGTHASCLGTIGFFKITKENSIAAGIRRIEAVTGKNAEQFVREEEKLLSSVAFLFKIPESKLLEKAAALLEENQTLQKNLKTFQKGLENDLAISLLEKVKKTKSSCALVEEISEEFPLENLASLVETLSQKIPSGFILLGIKTKETCHLILKISKDLVQKGFFAQELLQKFLPLIEGKGGGKKDLAQAGGKNIKGLKSALETARNFFEAL